MYKKRPARKYMHPSPQICDIPETSLLMNMMSQFQADDDLRATLACGLPSTDDSGKKRGTGTEDSLYVSTTSIALDQRVTGAVRLDNEGELSRW